MSFSNQSDNIHSADEKLGDVFYANGRYNALFLGVTAVGFLVIYLLTRFNVLGAEAPQLLYISGAVLFLAILQIPILNLAQRKRGLLANFFATIAVIVFAVLLTSFWESIAPIAILLIFITPVTAIMAGMPRRFISQFIFLIILGIGGILYVNTHPLINIRLQTATTAAIASLVFLGTTGLLLITVTIIARSKAYRSLRTQLLVSFIIIVTVPTLLATVLSAIGAYVNTEAQVLNVLETVAKLKEDQINKIVDNFNIDSVKINRDSDFAVNIPNLLAPGKSEPETLDVYRSIIRERLIAFRNADQKTYSEIMVLNVKGIVVVSTDTSREGKNLQSELFYQQGSLGSFAGFSTNPAFGKADLIYASPILETNDKVVRGVLVLRSNPNVIMNIAESAQSFSEMETYLINRDFQPITKTQASTASIHNTALDGIFLKNQDTLKGVYQNYAGNAVLGYYARLKALDVVFVSEVPRSFIIKNSLGSLFGSAVLAVFAIALAIAAVAISAESIANPIIALSKIAGSFAEGKLSSRALIDRRDEIGALGKAYDQMAEQLQDIIGKLEQRVLDRTKEFEDQTLRLRTSAEIARDAASSHNLNEVLDKAGKLIQERFGFYHTGIFLLDNNKEYAVLTASPTEAGKQMIANDHKLRVGEVGIVGRVAYTEEPRITLDTGLDAVHFNNPLLPNTRSEMALPLKVENRMIGVLDVQSDQPQAFDDDDIAIMQILADQLATALERTILLQQVEQNLSDLEHAYGQFTREGWKTLGESGLLSKAGYRFDNIRIQSITEVPELGAEAMKTGASVMHSTKKKAYDKNQVAIPIKLRGQTIGVVSANLKDGYTQNTISTLELAIERLALSLESARLYEEARLRADREQAIAQVTATISSANDFDSILRTTVEELGRSLGNSEVSIQIISDSNETSK